MRLHPVDTASSGKHAAQGLDGGFGAQPLSHAALLLFRYRYCCVVTGSESVLPLYEQM